MGQDIRFAFRIFRRSPGLTALILFTLALGIGANATLFSVVNSVLLRPLPYSDPERIVQAYDLFPATGGMITSSFPKFGFLRERLKSFDAFAAVSFTRFQLAGPAPAAPAEVQGARVSSDFFRVFGARLARGREFTEAEQRPGGDAVAVISDGLWRGRFGADPAAVGRTVTLDGAETVITGIAPPGFDFPTGTDVWTPRVDVHAVVTPVQIQRGASYLFYYARLAGGVQIPAAEAEIAALSREYDSAHTGFGDVDRAMRVAPLRDSLVSDVRLTLLVLLGAAGFVLLIASANIANFLLARALARAREVAIRASLGASRGRLLTQFLTESVLLASFGAALGVLLSWWSMSLMARMSPDLLPRAGEIRLDGAVLAFSAALAIVTGLLFGLGPALHSVRTDLNVALKTSGANLAGGGGLRRAMIVSEVALAVVLLAGAGLLIRSFQRLENVDPGFRPDHLLTMRISLAGARYPDRSQQAAFYDRLLEKTAALAGVRAAAVTNALPVTGRAIGYFFNIEGRPRLEPSKAPTFWLHSVSPAYFDALGVAITRGRRFTDADNAGAPLAAIINEGMAKRFWPNQDPIGRHIVYSRESLSVEIVGVAAEVKSGGLADSGASNELYVPYRQRPFLTMSLLVRGPESVAGSLRAALASVDPDQPAAAIRPMNDVISNSLSAPRLRTMLIASFAALALVLAAIGIAGVAAWSASRRSREIGIRMALGARPRDILLMLTRESLAMIALGELIGVAGSLALTRWIAGFLFGVRPWDPATYIGVTAALAAVGLATALFAGRRALRIDPVRTLRLE